jgi:hypothetical protein
MSNPDDFPGGIIWTYFEVNYNSGEVHINFMLINELRSLRILKLFNFLNIYMKSFFNNTFNSNLTKIYNFWTCKYPLEHFSIQLHITLFFFYIIFRFSMIFLSYLYILVRVKNILNILKLGSILSNWFQNKKIIFLKR